MSLLETHAAPKAAPPRMLIVSASIGGGHVAAARALGEAARERGSSPNTSTCFRTLRRGSAGFTARRTSTWYAPPRISSIGSANAWTAARKKSVPGKSG